MSNLICSPQIGTSDGTVCSVQYISYTHRLPVYIPGTRIGKAYRNCVKENMHIKMKCGSGYPAVTEALRLVLFTNPFFIG